MSFASGNAIAVQVEAHRNVARFERVGAEGLVKENALERIDRQVNTRDEKIQCDAQAAERVAQTLYAHERAAALPDVQRRRCDEAQSQYKV